MTAMKQTDLQRMMKDEQEQHMQKYGNNDKTPSF